MQRTKPARSFVACLLFLVVFGTLHLRAAEPVEYKLNDRIESNLSVFGWQKGTVTEVGHGPKAGQIKILTDGNASAGWVSVGAMKFVRKIKEAAPAAAASPNQAPRLGKYSVLSFGAGGKHLYLGHLELLSNGKYRVSRTASDDFYGAGTYTFDVTGMTVQWMSGPYKEEAGWGGAFEITREGKTHSIRLRSGTIATNSTD